jgi:DNA polymerase III subunit epsilon
MLSTDLLIHYRQLSQRSLTIVDVETSGLYPSEQGRIIEISVLQGSLADGIQHQQTTLMNPKVAIPDKIRQVTGISQAMVDAAPLSVDVLPDYLPLLRTGILTAHNLEFDYSFLRFEYTRLGTALIRPKEEQLCTVLLSRLMLPDLPSRSLPKLVKHFQFKVGKSHRAEADVQACWMLAERLFTELLNEPDEKLLERFAREWMPLKQAAEILGCSSKLGRSRLESAGVPSRYVGGGNNGTFMYRRSDVERVFYQQQNETIF